MNESAFNQGQKDAYVGRNPLFVKTADNEVKSRTMDRRYDKWDESDKEAYIDGYDSNE